MKVLFLFSFKQIFGSLETIKREIKEIKEVLLNLKSPLVFCHNDVLPANIIYNEKTGMIANIIITRSSLCNFECTVLAVKFDTC